MNRDDDPWIQPRPDPNDLLSSEDMFGLIEWDHQHVHRPDLGQKTIIDIGSVVAPVDDPYTADVDDDNPVFRAVAFGLCMTSFDRDDLIARVGDRSRFGQDVSRSSNLVDRPVIEVRVRRNDDVSVRSGERPIKPV